MRHPDIRVLSPIRLVIAAVVLTLSSSASAQWAYPGGYGGMGWSQWGADPGAGYMAGMGSYARGVGGYQVDLAKARAIERESLIKWNQALAVQRRALAAQQAAQAAQDQARDEARREARDLASGATLNSLLNRILEADPDASRVASARIPVTPELIRAIPFETASEPIALCLDEFTQGDSWPFPLSDPEYAAARQKVGDAVERALKEDAQGAVSDEAVEQVKQAVAALREQFEQANQPTSPGYAESDVTLKAISGLAGMLHNPALEPVLKELETYQGGNIGELIAFMQHFNLRFGAAESDRQREIYTRLAGILSQLLSEELAVADAPPPAGDAQALRSAAKEAFQGMSWDDLNQGAKTPEGR